MFSARFSSLATLMLTTACGPDFSSTTADDTAAATSADAGATTSTTDAGSGDGGGTTTTGGTPGEQVDYCHLQWPCSLGGLAGDSSDSVYVWVFEDGVTPGVGAGAGLLVEVGYGPDATDPALGGWTFSGAGWSSDKDGLVEGDAANDEYVGAFTLPSTAGLYDYCGRASADGGVSWLYCDLAASDGNGCGGEGSADGYQVKDAGSLTVK